MLLPYYCRLTLSSIVWVLNFQRDIFHLLNMIQHVTEMSLVHYTSYEIVEILLFYCILGLMTLIFFRWETSEIHLKKRYLTDSMSC